MQRKSMFVFAVGCLCCTPMLPAATRAQSLQLVAMQGKTEETSMIVNYRANNVTLEEALRAIGKQLGMRLSYSASEVPLTQRITVTLERTPVLVALATVTAGTGTEVRIAPDGETIMVSRAAASSVTRQGVITGRVVHAKTKQPVAGAAVSVGSTAKGITTNDDGSFRLAAPAGEQTIHVRAVGFSKATHKVTVAADGSVVVEVALEPSASVLDEVIVTGTVVATARKEIATPITVIRGEELERRGITRLEQLFRGEVPGIFVVERGASDYTSWDIGRGVKSTVYSRGAADIGGGPNPIKTYVDGVELLDASYLGTIDPQSIERIEIINGPQAATIYGSGAMGGVMQIFTKRGSANRPPEITTTLRYGILQNNYSDGLTPAHNHGISMQGGMGPGLSYSGNISYVYSGQWQPGLYSRSIGASAGASRETGKFTVGMSYSLSSSSRGTFYGGTDDKYGRFVMSGNGDWRVSAEAVAEQLSQQVSIASSQTASVNVDYRLLPSWQHHVTFGRSQNVMMLKPVAPNFFQNPVGSDTLFRVSRMNGQRITWNYNTSYVVAPSWFSSTLTLGANGSLGESLWVQGAVVSPTSQGIIGQYGASSAPNVSLPLNDRRWGAFSRWQVGIFRQLYTTFGFRLEQSPNYGRKVKFDFTPTNGLSYTLERGIVSLKLQGSYGRATRPPLQYQREERINIVAGGDPAQYAYQVENLDLRPEYSRGPQGGIELYIGNLGSLTLNHYHQTITDLIQFVIVDSVWIKTATSERWQTQNQYRNIAKVRQMGWEGTGMTQLGPFTVKGSYSWTDSRVLSLGKHNVIGYYKPGETFLGIPTHTGSATISYAHGMSNFTLVTNMIGAMNRQMREESIYRTYQYGRLRMYNIGRDVFSMVGRFPGYAKSDLSGTHRLTNQLSLSVNVLNVTNNVESDVSDLSPALGRQTTIGVSYRFRNR